MIWLVTLFLSLAMVFSLIGAVGAIRLPDFYTRAHAVGVLDTLSGLLVLTALALANGITLLSGKLLILLILIYVANPTVTHVFLRAAHKTGLKPWTRK